MTPKKINGRVSTAIREARDAVRVQKEAPSFTYSERNRFRLRHIFREEARRFELAVVFGRKKKLPLPVFACENTDEAAPDLAWEGDAS